MPQKRRIAIGCYVSLCHLSYGPTFMFVLVQRHEIVGIAVRLATCVRCAMIRLSLQAPLHQLAVLRLLALYNASSITSSFRHLRQSHSSRRRIQRHIKRFHRHRPENEPLCLHEIAHRLPTLSGCVRCLFTSVPFNKHTLRGITTIL